MAHAREWNWFEFFKDFDFRDPNCTVSYYYDMERDRHKILCTIRVRDSRGSGRMIPIDRWEIVESLTVFPREHRKAFALEMVRRLIQELYLHEIDEQIVYEGKLVFDPHADPSLPRPLKETAVV